MEATEGEVSLLQFKSVRYLEDTHSPINIMNIEFPKFKDYTNQKVNYIQPKLDGHLAKIMVDGTSLQAFTKNDKDITKKLLAIDHIRKELDGLPLFSVVFAELYCPNVYATSVPTMLNDADEKLMLTAFAAPLLGGADLINEDFIGVIETLKMFGLDVAEIKSVPENFVDKDDKEALLELAICNKWEGWVLKEEHMKGWYKLKPVKTVDAFVISTYQSFSSTHYGGLQSIGVAVWGENGKIHLIANVGSGFELKYRKQFDTHAKRANLLNRVCEVAFDSVAANGKLRFPRFIRWRDDKNINECTMEQLK